MPTTTRKKKSTKQEATVPLNELLTPVKTNPFERFVYMEQTIKGLDIAFKTNSNIILFGKGGMAKSDISETFLKHHGIDPFVFTMGTGTDEDKLFGGMDNNHFDKTGEIHYNVKSSFMNHEYVIFEEMMDAPDYILESLKDILSSGTFRNGSQTFKIKTKMIICCTNHDRKDFAKNTSLKALMERFPLEVKVEWPDYNENNYIHLFETVKGYSDPLLTYVLDAFNANKTPISPRIALKALELVKEFGPDSLDLLADFKAQETVLKDAIKGFKSVFEIQEQEAEVAIILQEVDKLIADNGGIKVINDISTLNEISKKLTSVRNGYIKMESIKTDEKNISRKADAVKRVKTQYETIKMQIDGKIKEIKDLLTQ